MQIANTNLPFGGVGSSGCGRYHGIEGFKQFSNPKSVLVNTPTDFKPFNVAFPPIAEFDKNAAMTGFDNGVGIWTWRGMRNKFIQFLLLLILIACIIKFRSFDPEWKKERMM